MKRRLPITNQGGFVVVAIKPPPVTRLAKAHRPTEARPVRARAAAQAERSASRAARPGSRDRRDSPTSPRATARAPKPAVSIGAREENRRTQSRAVVEGET